MATEHTGKDLTNILWNERHRADAEYLQSVLLAAGYDVRTVGAEIIWSTYSAQTMAASWLIMPESREELLERILPTVEAYLSLVYEK